MNLPFEYDQRRRRRVRRHHADHHRFRARPRRHPAGAARPHDVVRRRHAQRPARDSRRRPRTWSCGTRRPADRRAQHRHLHAAGDGVSVRDDGRGDRRDPARRRPRSSSRGKFPFVLGGEHSITAPVVARRGREASRAVGAADRRACRSARVVHGHAAQPCLRDAPGARVRARRRRSASAACRRRKPRPRRRCRPTIFYDFNMRQDADWIDRVVESLSETVYITIDCDGLDPAIMPAVGTPEPGGLSWYETLALLRRVIESRHGGRLRPRRAVPDARASSRRTSSAPS